MRPLALVRLTEDYLKICQKAGLLSAKEGFYTNLVFIFLGEIPNMPGHCVVAGRDGNVYFGRHTENFEEVPEDQT